MFVFLSPCSENLKLAHLLTCYLSFGTGAFLLLRRSSSSRVSDTSSVLGGSVQTAVPVEAFVVSVHCLIWSFHPSLPQCATSNRHLSIPLRAVTTSSPVSGLFSLFSESVSFIFYLRLRYQNWRTPLLSAFAASSCERKF
ncbi:hypothetical protein YC2023_034340 [Brassica napus]